jgi:hypothetical protein
MCGATQSCKLRTSDVGLLMQSAEPKQAAWRGFCNVSIKHATGRPIWRASTEVENCSMDHIMGAGRGQMWIFKVIDSRHEVIWRTSTRDDRR